MKHYYVVCSVKFTDNSDETPYNDEEIYSFIIQDSSKEKAKIQALEKARERFNEELNEEFDNIVFVVEDIYETSEDARLY